MTPYVNECLIFTEIIYNLENAIAPGELSLPIKITDSFIALQCRKICRKTTTSLQILLPIQTVCAKCFQKGYQTKRETKKQGVPGAQP